MNRTRELVFHRGATALVTPVRRKKIDRHTPDDGDSARS
jgi:hypothetical protein